MRSDWRGADRDLGWFGLDFEQQMQGQQLAIEVGLYTSGIAMGNDLGFEVDLDAFDGTFDARAFCVESSFGQGVLRVVPIDLGSEVAVDADVSTHALEQAGVSVGAAGANGLTCLIARCNPQETFVRNVAASQFEKMPLIADGDSGGGEVVDPREQAIGVRTVATDDWGR